MSIKDLINRPIVSQIQNNLPSSKIEVDHGISVMRGDEFKIINEYYKLGLSGAFSEVYIRTELLTRLKKILIKLPDGYKFVIFDGFRSMETQQAIFDLIVQKIMTDDGLSHQEAFNKTCIFVTNPQEVDPDHVPHNSGGAIDLSLMYQGEPLDMGTDFDETNERSYTDFFEREYDQIYQISEQRWNEIKKNRRLLVHCMAEQGFTNYESEWWHFDFGNHFWADRLKKEPLFKSCESQIPT